ncbi:MAG: glycosyltransferase family 39 protein [Chloroflexi bacterium]|nr:glycosyltransferase family 39 protein [Chloroflexota bacterium]
MLLVSAVLARLPLAVTQPMTHDESYTYIAFASQPLTNLVSDYHLPNNHIFHSVLVHFSTRLFGEQPLAVRLPALLAGVLVVLAVFLLARALYGDSAGLLASAITAVLPALAEISAEARGYSLLTLLVLLEFLLALYLRKHRNLWGWLFFAGIGALGFYSVPVMLYPFGIICLWLALSGLAGDAGTGYRSHWRFLGWLAGGVVLTAILTAILYSPVLKYAGADALFRNPFVLPLTSAEFLDLLPGRTAETWHIWQAGTASLLWLMVAGFVLSLLLHRSANDARIPPQAGLLWIPLVALIQRPNPWPKIWIYLLPLLVIWGISGWLLLAQKWVKQKYLSRIVVILAAILLLAGAIRDVPKILNLPGGPGETERAVILIAEEIEPGDALVAASPNDAPAWYYARLHGISKEAYTHLEERNPRRVFVLVNPAEGQTVESVLEERRLDPNGFQMSSARVVLDWGSTLVIELKSNQNR